MGVWCDTICRAPLLRSAELGSTMWFRSWKVSATSLMVGLESISKFANYSLLALYRQRQNMHSIKRQTTFLYLTLNHLNFSFFSQFRFSKCKNREYKTKQRLTYDKIIISKSPDDHVMNLSVSDKYFHRTYVQMYPEQRT